MKRNFITIAILFLIFLIYSCNKEVLNDNSVSVDCKDNSVTEQIKSCCDTVIIEKDTAIVTIKEVEITPEIIQPAKPKYSMEMLENEVEGFVNLKLLVGTDGNVKEYIILNDLGHGTNKAIHNALLKMKFSPARKEKKRASVWIETTMNFKCPKL